MKQFTKECRQKEREAKEFRAQGAEIAQKIRSTADKDVTVILAQANKKSEIMKGEGDGERNKIFANAFGRDPQFFAFYRAMQAYEKALIGGETSLVLSPDSEFFKFFGKSIKPKYKKISYKHKVKEIIIAIGLLFFIEGLFLAIFPSRIKNMLEMIKNTPENKLRSFGLFFLIIGFLIIWYIKN